MTRKFLYPVMAVVTVAFLFSSPARAAVIAYEDFNYGATDGQLEGLNGGSGFAAAWDRTYGNHAYYEADGLSFGDLDVSGGSAYFSSTDNTVATRLLASGLSGTVWGSYLFKVGADTPSQWNGVGLATIAGPQWSSQWQYVSAITNGSAPNVGIKGIGSSTDTDGFKSLDNTVMMMLFKITNTGAGSSTITEWILTLDQFEYWKNSTYGLDSLTASTPFGTEGATVWGRATTTGTADSLLNTTAYLGIHTFVQPNMVGSAPTYFDELRLGETADDVTPLGLVPEPMTVAFLGLGGLAMAGGAIRRRRGARD